MVDWRWKCSTWTGQYGPSRAADYVVKNLPKNMSNENKDAMEQLVKEIAEFYQRYYS